MRICDWWKYLKERPAPTALTGVAVLLAVYEAMPWESGWSATYDSEVAVLTATLIGLIWYTYHTHQGVQEARQAPKRRAEFRRRRIEAALLPELREVERRLGRTFPYFTHLHAPVLKRAVQQIEVFDDDLARMVSEVATAVGDVVDIRRARAELYRQAPGDWNERDAKLVRDLQNESKAGRKKVKALIAELEERQASA